MRLIFAGTPDVAVPALEAISLSSHQIIGVITRPDAPRGRGRAMAASAVAQRADELGIRVLKPTSLRDDSVSVELAELAPDCCPIVAYGGLVPPELLSLPTHGWVNLHFSLLPAWRGAAPVQHAVLHGDEVTGATTFRLTEGLDSGPVFGSVTESISTSDTSGALLQRLSESGAQLLLRTLDGIESGEIVPHAQSTDGVSWAPKLGVDDARIQWHEPGLAVDRRIRSCTPAPGAWTTHRQQRVGVLPLAHASRSELVDPPAPGELRVSKHEVWVGTGSFAVQLSEVRPAGKGVMSAADWARGARLANGDVLQ
jgi:methionyl-tRNA formyltransferase